MGAVDDVFGPDPVPAKKVGAVDAVFGPDPEPSIQAPSPLFFAQPDPSSEFVKQAILDRQNRDAASARSLMHGGLVSKFRNDALFENRFGKQKDIGDQAVRLASDYNQAQQQMAGTAEGGRLHRGWPGRATAAIPLT